MKVASLMLTVFLVTFLRCTDARANEVAVGDTRDEVIARLGEPLGTIRDAAGEWLLYRDKDIELKLDRVVTVRPHNVVMTNTKPKSAVNSPPTSSASAGNRPANQAVARDAAATASVSSPKTSESEPVLGDKTGATPRPRRASASDKFRNLSVGARVMIVGGLGLLVVGVVASAVAWVWFLVRAFTVHLGWGLTCLLVPFAPLVFLIKYWERARHPFFVSLGGGASAALGVYLVFAPFSHALARAASQAEEQLPPGVIQAGSLANEILIRDTMQGVAAQLVKLGCDSPERIRAFYVVSLPVGPDSAKVWKEKWIVDGCGQQFPVAITFTRSGPHGTIYVID